MRKNVRAEPRARRPNLSVGQRHGKRMAAAPPSFFGTPS